MIDLLNKILWVDRDGLIKFLDKEIKLLMSHGRDNDPVTNAGIDGQLIALQFLKLKIEKGEL